MKVSAGWNMEGMLKEKEDKNLYWMKWNWGRKIRRIRRKAVLKAQVLFVDFGHRFVRLFENLKTHSCCSLSMVPVCSCFDLYIPCHLEYQNCRNLLVKCPGLARICTREVVSARRSKVTLRFERVCSKLATVRFLSIKKYYSSNWVLIGSFAIWGVMAAECTVQHWWFAQDADRKAYLISDIVFPSSVRLCMRMPNIGRIENLVKRIVCIISLTWNSVKILQYLREDIWMLRMIEDGCEGWRKELLFCSMSNLKLRF